MAGGTAALYVDDSLAPTGALPAPDGTGTLYGLHSRLIQHVGKLLRFYKLSTSSEIMCLNFAAIQLVFQKYTIKTTIIHIASNIETHCTVYCTTDKILIKLK